MFLTVLHLFLHKDAVADDEGADLVREICVAEHEALRRIAVKYVPHGEALRELLLALHLGEMEMPHTLIIDDLHELLPPAMRAATERSNLAPTARRCSARVRAALCHSRRLRERKAEVVRPRPVATRSSR